MKGKSFSAGLVLAVAASAILALACTPPPTPLPATPGPAIEVSKLDWEQRWDQTVEAARKEGRALIYMMASPEVQKNVTLAFRQKFDIELDFLTGRGAVIAEKIFAERRAGLYLGDAIIQGNTVQLLIFKPKDVLEVLDPLLILPEVKDPKGWLGGRFPFLDKDHTVISFFAGRQNYVVRNTDLVSEGEVKSLSDLQHPKWKGQIVLFDPTVAGSGSGWYAQVHALLGKEKTEEYMRQFVKQEPVTTRDDRVIVEGVARGKYKLGVGVSQGLFTEFKKHGAPLEYVRTVDVNFLAPSMGDISVLKNAPHPKVATVFLNWLLTREAQTIVSRSHGTPSARVDVPTAGIDPYTVLPPGEKFYLEMEEDILYKDELMLRAKEIFAPVMK